MPAGGCGRHVQWGIQQPLAGGGRDAFGLFKVFLLNHAIETPPGADFAVLFLFVSFDGI